MNENGTSSKPQAAQLPLQLLSHVPHLPESAASSRLAAIVPIGRNVSEWRGEFLFLWATQPLHCDSVVLMQMDDYKGHTVVAFSNGDPSNPILGFAGGRIGGDGPLFFSDTVYLA